MVKRWKELISNSETGTVINEINKLYSTKETIILKNRWKELNGQQIKGIISQANYELERNKINDSILNLINRIENEDFDTLTTKSNNLKIFFLVGIAALLLVGMGYFLGEYISSDKNNLGTSNIEKILKQDVGVEYFIANHEEFVLFFGSEIGSHTIRRVYKNQEDLVIEHNYKNGYLRGIVSAEKYYTGNYQTYSTEGTFDLTFNPDGTASGKWQMSILGFNYSESLKIIKR